MDRFVIQGGQRLCGRLVVKGSKNAALPLMAASLLTDEPVRLHDVPALADIANMRGLLDELGCSVELAQAAGHGDLARMNAPGDTLRIKVDDPTLSYARYDVVRTMRASICVLGPLLAKRGYAKVSMPGGCAIGDRPVDLHLRGLAALGAEINLEHGDIVARLPKRGGVTGRLKGARIFLGGPFGSTVLGTANVMSAAALAQGTTVIECAACEPEVVDLASLLNSMGARISGAGSPRITIDGVESLGGASHRVIPDRIEAGTYMCAAAITNGDVTLENCPVDALMAVIDRLEAIGVVVTPSEPGRDAPALETDPMRTVVRVTCSRNLRPVEVTTQPHPGFPTDLQAQLMALLTIADGISVITERIYPERFLHVAELSRMGARIQRQGATAVVSGTRRLIGAPVMASDLRASACLVLAGMAAEGTTTVNRVYHLDRGYEQMEVRLRSLGAVIERVGEKQAAGVAAAVEAQSGRILAGQMNDSPGAHVVKTPVSTPSRRRFRLSQALCIAGIFSVFVALAMFILPPAAFVVLVSSGKIFAYDDLIFRGPLGGPFELNSELASQHGTVIQRRGGQVVVPVTDGFRTRGTAAAQAFDDMGRLEEIALAGGFVIGRVTGPGPPFEYYFLLDTATGKLESGLDASQLANSWSSRTTIAQPTLQPVGAFSTPGSAVVLWVLGAALALLVIDIAIFASSSVVGTLCLILARHYRSQGL